MSLTNEIQALSLLTKVLTITFPDQMKDAFTKYEDTFAKHFPLEMDPIGDGGRRYDFYVGPTDNTRALGRLTTASLYPRPGTQRTYGSFVLQPAHINSLDTPLTVNYADLEYAQNPTAAYDLGFRKAMDANLDMAEKRAILRWRDRRGTLGKLAAQVNNTGSGTDDSTNSRYTFTLYLDETTSPKAFTVGRLLHIAVDATPIAAVRNYHTPVRVLEDIAICGPSDPAGAVYKVVCEQSYLSADITAEGGGSGEGKTEIATALGNMADGDLVCVWGGATNDTTWDGTSGPNYGFWGIRDLYGRTNIQTATGACSTAIYTWEGGVTAGVAMDRASGANFGWLAPKLIAKAGAQITWTDIDSLFLNLDLIQSGEPANWLLMNTLVIQSLANQAGTSGHRFNGSATAVEEAIFAKYGVRGVVYQSLVRGPIVLVADDNIAPDMVLAPIAGAIRRVSPANASFVPGGIQGIWDQRHDATTAKRQPVYDANLHESSQLIPDASIRLAGAITGGKP